MRAWPVTPGWDDRGTPIGSIGDPVGLRLLAARRRICSFDRSPWMAGPPWEGVPKGPKAVLPRSGTAFGPYGTASKPTSLGSSTPGRCDPAATDRVFRIVIWTHRKSLERFCFDCIG